MILKKDLKDIEEKMKDTYTDITIIDSTIEEKEGGMLWFLYTFTPNYRETEYYAEYIKDTENNIKYIPEKCKDIVYFNSIDIDINDLVEDLIGYM